MHPWLLPTPLLALLSRRLIVGARGIAPADLRDPEFVRTLNDAERAEAVRIALDRIASNGAYMASLRDQRLGPAFKIDGNETLDKLTEDGRLTLTKAARSVHLPELESVPWGRVLTLRAKTPSRAALILALAQVEWLNRCQPTVGDERPDLRRMVTELLRDPRIDDILEGDLRYSWRHLQAQGSLVSFLSEVRAGEPTEAQRRYVQKLWRGFQRSLAEDIEDIGRELVHRALSQPAARLRTVEIFAARFGVRPTPPQLEAIAKQYGISGTRVIQVTQRVINARGTSTLASPAVSRLLAQIRQHEYLSLPLLEQKFGLAPGSGHSLATLKRFVQTVLFPSPTLDFSAVQTQAGDVLSAERRAVASPAVPPKHLALIRLAQRQCRAAGAANLTQLAGVIALSGNMAVGRADLENIVDELPQARWLDREHGWFVLDDLADSLVYHRARKILAVAQRAVGVKEIGEALYRDSRLADETDGEFALAPLRILKLAMLTWPGIEEERPGWLVDRSGTAPADVLAPNELKIYEVLAARGGIAPTDTVARLTGAANLDSIRAVLPMLPFAYAPVTGVYALRGWRIGRPELLAALAESTAAGLPDPTRPGTIMVIRPH